MRLMIRVVVPMTLILSACIGLVIFIARQQPLPPRLAMLHLTDCAPPCWIGITPGVTTVEQVKAQIEAVYGDPKTYRVNFDQNDLSTLTIIRIDEDDPHNPVLMSVSWWAQIDGTIGDLAITSSIDVADVANLLGAPSSVLDLPTAGNNGGYFALAYKNTIVEDWSAVYPHTTSLFSGTVNLHDRTGGINFYPINENPEDFGTKSFKQWRGFGATYSFRHS